MKRILLYSVLLALAGLALTACNDDKKDEVAGLEIVKTSLEFEALGGEGVVMYSAGEKATAEVDADWARVKEITADKVIVEVDPAPDNLESRVCPLTIKAAGTTLQLAVYQEGLILGISQTSFNVAWMAGSEASAPYLSNYPVTVQSKPDWLDVNLNGEFITFTVNENNEDVFNTREGEVVLKSGEFTRKLEVVQGERAKYYDWFLGEWRMRYDSNGKYKGEYSYNSRTVTFREDVSGESFIIGPFPIWTSWDYWGDLKADYNPVDGTITIRNGQYMNEFVDNNDYYNYIYLNIARFRDDQGSFNVWFQDNYYFKFRWNEQNILEEDHPNSNLPDDMGYGHMLITEGYKTPTPTLQYEIWYWWTKFHELTFEKL